VDNGAWDYPADTRAPTSSGLLRDVRSPAFDQSSFQPGPGLALDSNNPPARRDRKDILAQKEELIGEVPRRKKDGLR